MIELIIPSLFLSIFGIFTVLGVNQHLLLNQIIYFLIGFSVYFIIRKIGRNYFQINSRLFYWIFIALLIITFAIGLEVKGSKRWIDFYFFKFQASEFFKIFFILYLSEFLSRKHIKYENFGHFLKSLLYFLIPTLIIFKQPDLGNALVFVAIFVVMILFSDFPKKYFLSVVTSGMLFLPMGWFLLKSYQKDRILSFINPHIDTQGTAYNMIQAVITVGSGQFLGRGLGLGTQSRLFFLPENYTDFAFSSLVEQFGFIGGIMVVVFFGFIMYFLVKRMIKFYFQHDEEGRRKFLYILGLITYLLFQIVINVCMNMGLLPVAGIALPFISYGGSSVLALLIGFALVP